jgi:hypothetical protein
MREWETEMYVQFTANGYGDVLDRPGSAPGAALTAIPRFSRKATPLTAGSR